MIAPTLSRGWLKSVAPRSRKQTGWIGIDLGSRTLKLAQAGVENGAWSLEMCRIVELPEAASLSNGMPGDDSLANAIRSAVAAAGHRRMRQAGCVLSTSCTDIRSLELPSGGPDELRQMIAVELGILEDDPATHAEFDYLQSPAQRGSELVGVTVISTPSRSGCDLDAALRRAGLECRTLDSLPCVLARAVALAEPGLSQRSVAAVDWGCTAPTFTLVQGGRAVFTRVLRHCGLLLALDAIGEQLQASPGDSRELLASFSRTADSSAPKVRRVSQLLRRAIEPALAAFVGEVQRTVEFLRSQAGHRAPECIRLFGGGACITEVETRLAATTGLPTASWRLNAHSPPNPVEALLAPAIALSAMGIAS